MKTKQQKKQELTGYQNRLTGNRILLFTDFRGVSASNLDSLRSQLRELDSEFKVTKKRILRLAFSEKGINLNPEEFAGQLGVVFSPREVIDLATLLYQFSKKEENFKVLGGYDLSENQILGIDYLNRLASLPSREILLGQLVGMLAAPIKMFMLTLKERAKTL